LGVDKTANAAAIKKAYHKLALLSHPDKNKDDPAATANFQRLQKVTSLQVIISNYMQSLSYITTDLLCTC
jgi:preprotein translocase subunit Sec63